MEREQPLDARKRPENLRKTTSYGETAKPEKTKRTERTTRSERTTRTARSARSAKTAKQKRTETDLLIMFIVMDIAFLIYGIFSDPLTAFVRNADIPLLLRLVVNAAVQFAIAGLGMTIVCLWRGERFTSFGLRRKNALRAVAGTILCFVPYMIYVFASGSFEGYRPFGIIISYEVTAAGFPMNVVGMAIIILVWGFFEGFNYVVACDKINARYRVRYIDIGAAVCALVCLIFHPAGFSLWGVIGMLTVFVAIYSMLRVKAITGNAWGCIFAFFFIWNAI